MSEERDLLERLADRGEARGAHEVLASARAEAGRRVPATRRTVLVAAAAAVAVVVVGVTMLAGPDDATRVGTTDERPDPRPTAAEPTTSTTTAVDGRPAGSGETLFAFDIERGLVRVGDGSEPESLGGLRGEEGETHVAVSADGRHLYHDIVATGCLQQIVRTGLDGSSEVVIESGILPAPDATGRYLAYAAGTTCTSDADVLVVRDLTTDSEEQHQYGGDGLPTRIEDIEWVDGQIVVLARQYDGEAAASAFLDIYDVAPSGVPEPGGSVPGDGNSRATQLDQIRGIEPIPGRPSTLLATSGPADRRGPTTFVTIDLATGAMTEQFVVDPVVTSFAARAADDVYYVGIEPKVDGVSGQVDRLVHRSGGRDSLIATGLNSVAI